MMRHRTKQQEKLYQQYANLGKIFYKNSSKNKKFSFGSKWELITQEGIWKLPVSKQYGGMDLSWQETIIAMNGLISTSQDYEFLSYIIKQFTVIYLILQHKEPSQKKLFLPRLMSGELIEESSFIKSDENNHVHQDLIRFKKFLYESSALDFVFSLIKKYGHEYYNRSSLC